MVSVYVLAPRGVAMSEEKSTKGFVLELLPFWFGAIATSFVSGSFIREPVEKVNIPIIPLIFVGSLALMHVTAFTSFSVPRKNLFGLFLGLFSVFFWIGTLFDRLLDKFLK
jgi:hypothetical protein